MPSGQQVGGLQLRLSAHAIPNDRAATTSTASQFHLRIAHPFRFKSPAPLPALAPRIGATGCGRDTPGESFGDGWVRLHEDGGHAFSIDGGEMAGVRVGAGVGLGALGVGLAVDGVTRYPPMPGAK